MHLSLTRWLASGRREQSKNAIENKLNTWYSVYENLFYLLIAFTIYIDLQNLYAVVQIRNIGLYEFDII